MKCTYCNKEIDDASTFCPECGQSFELKQKSTEVDNYWTQVNSDTKIRNQQHLKDKNNKRVERNIVRNKKIKAFVLTIISILLIVGIIVGVAHLRSTNFEQVKRNLPGKELSYTFSRTESGFWIHYYYYTLKFNDDGTLDYYYLTTIGPAEDGEVPVYEGTFSYSITQNFLNSYSISFENETFSLKVLGNNVPVSITHE